MLGTSWGCNFYSIHEGTITGTLIKLKPKQETVYITQGVHYQEHLVKKKSKLDKKEYPT